MRRWRPFRVRIHHHWLPVHSTEVIHPRFEQGERPEEKLEPFHHRRGESEVSVFRAPKGCAVDVFGNPIVERAEASSSYLVKTAVKEEDQRSCKV